MFDISTVKNTQGWVLSWFIFRYIFEFKLYIMLKNVSNLGSVLNKAEQQSISGGKPACNLQCTWILDPIACKCIGPNLD